MTVYEDVDFHARQANARFGPFASLHEAYGVLVEEVTELLDAVRLRQDDPRRQGMAEQEAIDVAAVAIRIAEQCRAGMLTR